MKFDIASEIIHRAQDLATSQGTLAISPAGRAPTGEVVMCAAACVAYAAIEKRTGAKAAQSFRNSLLSRHASEKLLGAFESFGSTREICTAMLKFNNAQPVAQRLDWFLSLKSDPDSSAPLLPSNCQQC